MSTMKAKNLKRLQGFVNCQSYCRQLYIRQRLLLLVDKMRIFIKSEPKLSFFKKEWGGLGKEL